MRIRAICWALLLGLPAAPAQAAEWWYVAVGGRPGDQRAYYSDRSSIRRAGDRVTVWEQSEYQRPNDYGSVSAKLQIEYDCRRRTSRLAHTIFYSADGSVNASGPGTEPAQPVAPDTIAEAALRFACGEWAGIRRVQVADLRTHAFEVFR